MYFSGKNKKAPRFCLGALNLFFAERTKKPRGFASEL